jgi:PAS domain S-box-containing protein
MSTSPDKLPLVLIVDDTPANFGVLADLLSAHDFDVSVAEGGACALQKIEYLSPDLILLDVLMPDLDGYATCERLKRHPRARDIPVVFMTGVTDTTSKVRGFQLGAVDYITKPFEPEEVIARIHTHLTMQRLRRRLQESEARLKRILESAIDAIVTIDESGRITFFNEAAEQMFRCSAARALGEPCGRFLSEPLRRIIVDAEPGRPAAMWVPEGHNGVRADGEIFLIEASLSRAQTGGQIINTLILRDVHERNEVRLREMSARMQRDIEDERKRISHALHDEMGQNLTALRLDTDWLRRHCAHLPAIVDTVERMERSIEDSAAAMRRIVADMRPRVLDDLGLDIAIKGLVKDVSTRTGIRMKLATRGEFGALDDETKTALFRMLQECLTNVTRHARATQVEVLLTAGAREIQMMVIDNGVGFAPQMQSKPGSFGLFGLGERAQHLGGTVAVESEPNKGTRIVVQLPLLTKLGEAVQVPSQRAAYAS